MTPARPLSILLIANGLPPEQVGGVEQHVSGLARELVGRGHRVHIYSRTSAPGREPGTLVEGALDGIPVTRVVYRWEGCHRLRDLYRVRVLDEAFQRFLAQHRFDVVHVHHLTGLSVGVLKVLHATPGIGTVMTLHDYWTLCPRGQMFHRHEELCEDLDPARCGDCLTATFPGMLPDDRGGAADKGFLGETLANHHDAARSLHDFMRQQLRLPNLLVTPAARTRAVFEHVGIPPHRITVVPNGVDLTALAGVPRLVPPRVGERLRIGYLGTLLPSKGLHVLMQAFLRLPADRTELRIHGNAVPYHGDAGYLTRVFGALTPGRHVHYGGPYALADLPRILADLHVVAVPALWNEAFGLTPREARAAGRPVVIAAIGGLTEGLTDGRDALVVPAGDVDALTAALGRFLADPELLLRMGTAATNAPRGFAAMTDDLERIYRRVAAPVTGTAALDLWSADLDRRARVVADGDSLGLSILRWREADGWQSEPTPRHVIAQDLDLVIQAAARALR